MEKLIITTILPFILFFCQLQTNPNLEESDLKLPPEKETVRDSLPLPPKNGFELSNLKIPHKEIFRGGPPRDGIPSTDDPKFVKAEEDQFLKPDDYVLGVEMHGMAKAYPIRILNWHEIVNDVFGRNYVVITYCPLCGSGMAFKAVVNGARKTFGVSGLLYNSDVLLYDRQTNSLWSQIMSMAVAGPESGKKLEYIPTEYTTWEEWKTRHPNTLVLTTETGYSRDYDYQPYSGYELTPKLMFPVSKQSTELKSKEKVLGIAHNGKFRAYPFSQLKKSKEGPVKDEFNRLDVVIYYDKKTKTARAEDAKGKKVAAATLYWFAWYAFHPETEVYKFKK